jgi:hypothetical protein
MSITTNTAGTNTSESTVEHNSHRSPHRDCRHHDRSGTLLACIDDRGVAFHPAVNRPDGGINQR